MRVFGFFTFLPSFTVFMHIWQLPIRVLRFEFVSSLGSSFGGFYWLGIRPIHGVFKFIYHNTVLHSIEALICVSRIHKLEFLIFDVLFHIWSAWLFHFPCLAKFVYWLLDEKCNEALRLCLLCEICHVSLFWIRECMWWICLCLIYIVIACVLVKLFSCLMYVAWLSQI